MKDSFVHKGKRRILIDYLKNKIGIKSAEVLDAINQVPRHLFLESVFEDLPTKSGLFPLLQDRLFRILLLWQNRLNF